MFHKSQRSGLVYAYVGLIVAGLLETTSECFAALFVFSVALYLSTCRPILSFLMCVRNFDYTSCVSMHVLCVHMYTQCRIQDFGKGGRQFG